jgi:hypothetical protein
MLPRSRVVPMQRNGYCGKERGFLYAVVRCETLAASCSAPEQRCAAPGLHLCVQVAGAELKGMRALLARLLPREKKTMVKSIWYSQHLASISVCRWLVQNSSACARCLRSCSSERHLTVQSAPTHGTCRPVERDERAVEKRSRRIAHPLHRPDTARALRRHRSLAKQASSSFSHGAGPAHDQHTTDTTLSSTRLHDTQRATPRTQRATPRTPKTAGSMRRANMFRIVLFWGSGSGIRNT